MTHRNYATLFDRNYLAKGLVLYESLKKYSSEPFTLHVLAMCKATERILNEMALENVRILTLTGFETAMDLGCIKAGRTWPEYCWTCGSCLMEYLMPWMDGEGISYVDSDLMFFSDPKAVFDELGERSVAIVPHRFPAHKQHMERNGVYNVGMVTARNTDSGLRCISRWAQQCREWCYARNEGGKFGDQAYLDSWPTDFPGQIASIENIGVGLAPWNIANYSIRENNGQVFVNDNKAVFYHYHEFVDEKFLTGYAMRPEDLALIYCPYVTAFMAARERIEAVEESQRKRMVELKAQGERA